jgi:hypothetical protein
VRIRRLAGSLGALGALAAFAAFVMAGPFAAAGCSATSEPIGNGACDGFCTKVVNLRCHQTLEREACVASCIYEQTVCPETMSEVIRCATNEGAIACDTSTLAPHVVNCDAARAARDACIQRPIPADAGLAEADPLPFGL